MSVSGHWLIVLKPNLKLHDWLSAKKINATGEFSLKKKYRKMEKFAWSAKLRINTRGEIPINLAFIWSLMDPSPQQQFVYWLPRISKQAIPIFPLYPSGHSVHCIIRVVHVEGYRKYLIESGFQDAFKKEIQCSKCR